MTEAGIFEDEMLQNLLSTADQFVSLGKYGIRSSVRRRVDYSIYVTLGIWNNYQHHEAADGSWHDEILFESNVKAVVYSDKMELYKVSDGGNREKLEVIDFGEKGMVIKHATSSGGSVSYVIGYVPQDKAKDHEFYAVYGIRGQR